MNVFSELQRNIMCGDITEDHGDVVYIGTFDKGDETGKDNCMIRRITRTVEENGVETTRVMYADGENAQATHTWAYREEYKYKYPKTK